MIKGYRMFWLIIVGVGATFGMVFLAFHYAQSLPAEALLYMWGGICGGGFARGYKAKWENGKPPPQGAAP